MGLNAVDAFIAHGEIPRCGRRARSNAIPLRRRKVPTVIADIDDPPTLARAFEGARVVVHAAGHYPRDSRHPDETLARARREITAVLDAAAQAGVARLVYVSSTATVRPRPDGRPSTEADVYPRAPGIGPYHDAKWLMEQAALAERRLEVVVACPAACLGPWDLRVGTSALLVATARGQRPAHPDGPIALIDARDVGRALVRLATMPAPPRRVLLASHLTRLHDLLGALARRYRVAPPPAPLSDAQALAFADAEEERVAGTPERPRLPREIVDLVIHGVHIDAGLGASLVDHAWTPLGQTLDAFDGWARRLAIVPVTPETRLEPYL